MRYRLKVKPSVVLEPAEDHAVFRHIATGVEVTFRWDEVEEIPEGETEKTEERP